MGEAKEIVGTPQDEYKPSSSSDKDPVLCDLTAVIDKLDRAIQVKQKDLATEGSTVAPENHYKLGILKAAEALIRRARAMLQDYGSGADAILPVDKPKKSRTKKSLVKRLLSSSKDDDDDPDKGN